MPFASGRYQSRLFNFFHRRTQKLSDRVGRTWRQVKVTTGWSLQAFIYPVLMLIQNAVDSADKQLQSGEPKKQSFLHSHVDNEDNNLKQDTPENLQSLTEIEHLLQKMTGGNQSSLPQSTDNINKSDEHENQLISLELIDATIAKLESNTLVPVSRAALVVKDEGVKLLQVIQDKLQIFVYGSEITPNLDSPHESNHLENQNLNIPGLRIKNLIRQAINYFFSFSNHQISDSTELDSNFNNQLFSRQTTVKSFPRSRAFRILPGSQHQDLIPENNCHDPWLTFDDLFGDDVTFLDDEEQGDSQTENPRLPGKLRTPKLLKQYQQGGNLATIKKSSQTLSQPQNISPNSQKIAVSQTNVSRISPIPSWDSQNEQQEIPINKQIDVIEVQVNTVTYDKHPLEVILEWLDSLLLWLEEKFVQIFQFVQQQFMK
ncbi:hypothetical protein [Calothrix sp. UHCC 0171]|uniref:hypothetical protein n=1 Tax=Calothrix sp. UHCC 0171 TaxID=3110245 RepID=UPI002B2141F8|nr:hypothetical protein [Calothrix sp. UHCC 0171]MEA5569572.1 hypothetical protein [Calothrix sp. UHCC 0171]